MSEDSGTAFDLPSVCRKKLSVSFDGGQLSSNAGVLLLRGVEKRLGLAARLAGCIRDRRNPKYIEHTQEEMLRLRMFAIASGYEDADDCDSLRHDPIFKMAVGRLPESGDPLCSQPTMSRLENAPSKIEIARAMAAMVDQFCESYRRAPCSITLDIDDTFDAVHGHQQMSLFNAHYDERCFLPIHIYEGGSGKPVAVILREGKTPTGVEVRTILKHVIGRIRSHWPKVRILVRGDSHGACSRAGLWPDPGGRVEAMEWCEEQGIDYIFGFGGNTVLKAMTQDAADALCVRRATGSAAKLRSFAVLSYAARSWSRQRRIAARIEATAKGLDIRYIVTSLKGTAKHLYETVYCGRGQAENFIKWHKAQLASDRTSCRDPKANQFRLILHTAAYWLMLTTRDAIAKRSPLSFAEFATLRLRLIKIAARVIEGAARIRIFLPTACPDRAVFRALAGRLCAAGP
jgi:hypothetical protein